MRHLESTRVEEASLGEDGDDDHHAEEEHQRLHVDPGDDGGQVRTLDKEGAKVVIRSRPRRGFNMNTAKTK